MTPTLSLYIPTAGRPTIRRAIESVADQVLPGDEVIVCGDTHDGPLPATEAICAEYPFVRYIGHDAGRHDWGHSQCAAAIAAARGEFVNGADDDDRWTPGALDAMREAIVRHGRVPLMFRFVANFGAVVWQRPYVIGKGLVGGHCLCAPNVPDRLGTWGPEYEGDYEFVAGTIARWGRAGVAPVWIDRIIARQRDR
jgi:glycosyltransferase involved in cell wall biosynthesis